MKIVIYIIIFFFQCQVFAQQSTLSKKNEKVFKRSKKSTEIKENASGDEPTLKKYNVNSPKNAVKPNKDRVDVTPEKVQKTSKQSAASKGDLNQGSSVSSPSYLPPVPQTGHQVDPKKVRTNKTKELKKNSSGDINTLDANQQNSNSSLVKTPKGAKHFDPKVARTQKAAELKSNATGDLNTEDLVPRNSNSSLVRVPRGAKHFDPKEARTKKAAEMKENASGDINFSERFTVLSPSYLTTPPDKEIVRDLKAIRHAKAAELRQNASGDLDVKKKVKRNLTIGLKMFEMKNEYPEIRKRNGREAASSGGDVEEIFQIRQYIEEYMSRLQSNESGLTDAAVLKNLKKHREEYDKEMGSNTGDINGTAKDKINREKAKSAAIASYLGNINVDLKKRNKKTKELSHEMAVNTGDILLNSVKSFENNNRAKTKRATSYRGDILLTSIRKGSHPSAIYLGGNKANSLEDKERARKRYLRKSRKDKGIEDPLYMKKPATQPKFNEEEYKIWEVRGRGVAPE